MVSRQELEQLMEEIRSNEGVEFTVDLPVQTVTTGSGKVVRFDIDEFCKQNLLLGLDDIGLTLQHEERIDAFEAAQKQRLPWLWQ